MIVEEFRYDPQAPDFHDNLASIHRTLRDHYPVCRSRQGGCYTLSLRSTPGS